MKFKISAWTIVLIILLCLMAWLHSGTENSMAKQQIECEELDAEQFERFMELEYDPEYPLQHLSLMDLDNQNYDSCIKEYNRFEDMNSFQGYAVIILFLFILMSWRIDNLKRRLK